MCSVFPYFTAEAPFVHPTIGPQIVHGQSLFAVRVDLPPKVSYESYLEFSGGNTRSRCTIHERSCLRNECGDRYGGGAGVGPPVDPHIQLSRSIEATLLRNHHKETLGPVRTSHYPVPYV